MYSYCNKCVSDKSLCSQCRDNPEVQKILASLPKQSFFDVKGTGNWYSPIGQYVIWNGGIPAADDSAQLETELWVRTDRFADANQMKIYNGSIIAKDYIEI